MIEQMEVLIWGDKAYLPVLGKTEVGFFWDTEALITCAANAEDLAEALQEVARLGNPSMRHPTRSEFRKWTPVQKAIGTGSWKKMARMEVLRAQIWWTEDGISVAFSPRGARDIQETNFANQSDFAPDAPMATIAEHILREASFRQQTTDQSNG